MPACRRCSKMHPQSEVRRSRLKDGTPVHNCKDKTACFRRQRENAEPRRAAA